MDIVNIEGKTFESVLSAFEDFAKRMEHLCDLHGDKDKEEWLDSQDVCQRLSISKRTLQTLRDNGTIAYSQINHKIYYKPADVEKMLPIINDRLKLVGTKKSTNQIKT
jgi:hypothetical protein